ncbi:MAG: Smr/MutS family protein, partial [Clostridia bacterium]
EVKKVKNQNEILSKDREQLLYNSKIESKRIIARAQEEAKELIEEIKSIQKRAALMDESDLFKARAVSKKIGDLRFNIEKDIADEPEDYVYGEKMKINDIAIGKTVYVKKLNSRAIVQNIDKNERISIRVGKMNTIVKIDELYYCAEIKSVEKKIDKSSHTEIKSAPAKMEINLLGKNVDESILEIDPFIDAAVSEKITELRIIHGMGTGALRAGLHKYFKTDKRIKEFRLGRYGEGESGVTILTLKDDKSK